MDLMVLPLSYLVLNVLAFAICGAIAWRLMAQHVYLWLALADAAVLGLYVMRGWQLSHVGPRGLWDLARAPGFMVWKVLVMVSGRKSQAWVRTDRERP